MLKTGDISLQPVPGARRIHAVVMGSVTGRAPDRAAGAATASPAMGAPPVPSAGTVTMRPLATPATWYVRLASAPVPAAPGPRRAAACGANRAGPCTSTSVSTSMSVGQRWPPAKPCKANQFCVNTDGAYECRDCAKACAGCMGAGPARCKRCNAGYRRDGANCLDVDECEGEAEVCPGAHELCENTDGSYRCACAEGYERSPEGCVPQQLEEPKPGGFFSEVTDDEVVVLQQMFFGVIICALATLAAKGDMVFTANVIGAVAAMAGYWLSERSDRVLDGFIKGR